MRIVSALIILGIGQFAVAQQNEGTAVELAPIAVSGTFQLQLAHPDSDRAAQTIAKAILQKEATEKARPSSLLFDAKFWRYVPFKFSLPGEQEFLAPSYSTAAYRNAEKQLRSAESNPLISQ